MMGIFINYYEAVSVILFGVGFSIMLLHRNLIRKVIGMNIIDVSIFMYLATKGYVKGGAVPIVDDSIGEVSNFVNPLPGGLVLTGIVVSVCMTAFALGLIKLYYDRFGTLDLDDNII